MVVPSSDNTAEAPRGVPPGAPPPDPSPPDPASPPRSAWPLATLLWLSLFGLALLANPDTTAFVWHVWQSDAYGHSPLLALLAVWLIWRRRRELAAVQPTPSPWGLMILSGIALCWWLGLVIEFRALQQLALTASVAGLAWSLLGARAAWLLAFPLLYLFLTVSAWDALNYPLQDATTWLATRAVRLLGIPVFQDGYYLSIPEGRFLIDVTCNGLRYFLAGLSIGALYAYLTFDDLWRRGVFISLTMLWALLINALRVTVIIYLGHVTDMQHSFIKAHDNFGWILFGASLILLFLAGALLQRTPAAFPLQPLPPPSSATRAGPAAFAAAGLAAALLLSAPTPGAQWLAQRAQTIGQAATLPQAPSIAGWEGPLPVPEDWNPRFHGADAEIKAGYRRDGITVLTYQGWYAYERPDAKLISYQNQLFERQAWSPIREGTYALTLPRGVSRVREHELGGGGFRPNRLIWSWYRVAGRDTTRPYQAKLLLLLGLLRGVPESSVIAVGIDLDGDREAARQALRRFLAEAGEGHF